MSEAAIATCTTLRRTSIVVARGGGEGRRVAIMVLRRRDPRGCEHSRPVLRGHDGRPEGRSRFPRTKAAAGG